MANIKISELDEAATVTSNDLFVMVDTTEDETKKVKANKIITNVNDSYSTSQTEPYSANYNNGHFMTKGVELYSSTGTTDEIELSDSAANYDFLEIYYWGDNGNLTYDMKKAESPNGKWLSLNYTTHNAGGTFWLYSTRVNINGNKITPSVCGRFYVSGGSVGGQNNTNYINIYKVIGYKL